MYEKLSKTAEIKVKYYLPNNDVLTNLSELFSAFSDSTRIKILFAICIEEMCVGDIATLLEINQTTVSHQLKILKDKGVVSSRRNGKIIYYSLADKVILELMKYGTLFLGYY